ncbi:putative transcription factor WD40-like family [Dioscorea sansibarensis]
MSPPFFIFIVFPLLTLTLAHSRHIINITAPTLHPTSLAWDPKSQHFLLASRFHPIISSISDAGIVQIVLSSDGSSVNAIAIDSSHRTLLAALSNPPSVAAYDLRSPRPHALIFLSPLPAAPSGLAVDDATGAVFATVGNLIYKIDPEGNSSIFSEFNAALGGVVHVSRGFLLVAQPSTGMVYKVDDETGRAKSVLGKGLGLGLGLALRSDGSALIGGDDKMRVVRSEDGWGEAVVVGEVIVDKGVLMGVVVRDGRKVYALVEEKDDDVDDVDGGILGRKFRIEEVDLGRDGGDDMIVMGKLASSLNKKRA